MPWFKLAMDQIANGLANTDVQNGHFTNICRTKARRSGRSSTASTPEQSILLRDFLRDKAAQATELVWPVKWQKTQSWLRSTSRDRWP